MLGVKPVLKLHTIELPNWPGFFFGLQQHIFHKRAGVNSVMEYMGVAARFFGLFLFIRSVGKDSHHHHNNPRIYKKTCGGTLWFVNQKFQVFLGEQTLFLCSRSGFFLR